jgi:hypothetical protein
MKPRASGTVTSGKIVLDNYDREVFNRWLLTMEGKRVELVYGKATKHRSDAQRRYWYGVVMKLLGDHLGYTTEEMNSAVEARFLTTKHPGKPDTIRSTESLTTIEQEELNETVKRWGMEDFGVFIPDPQRVEA